MQLFPLKVYQPSNIERFALSAPNAKSNRQPTQLSPASRKELLGAAEQIGFEILITADSNPSYQQNLAGKALAVIVLGTNRWGTISQQSERVVEAVSRCQAGGFIEVTLERPPARLKRRDRKPEP